MKNILSFFSIFLVYQCILCQGLKEEKMAQLAFMVGEWVGTSKAYTNGKLTREIPAFENIAYDLDSSILVLQLNSESLLLHTIIYYDENDSTYYYYPFSKRGVRPAPASFMNGQLIVQSSETKRFVFGSTDDGRFREYGEVLTNGKWVKYFQDDFTNTQ